MESKRYDKEGPHSSRFNKHNPRSFPPHHQQICSFLLVLHFFVVRRSQTVVLSPQEKSQNLGLKSLVSCISILRGRTREHRRGVLWTSGIGRPILQKIFQVGKVGESKNKKKRHKTKDRNKQTNKTKQKNPGELELKGYCISFCSWCNRLVTALRECTNACDVVDILILQVFAVSLLLFHSYVQSR